MAWLDGVKCDDALLKDRGLLLGLGVFETIHIRCGRVILGGGHYKRLIDGCDFLEIAWRDCDFIKDFSSFMQMLVETFIKHFEGTCPQDVVVRVTVTAGQTLGRSVALSSFHLPHVMLHFSEFTFSSAPLSVVASSCVRYEGDGGSRHKMLSYYTSARALDVAAHAQVDEALLVNSKHLFCSAALGNIFVIKDGVLMTPGVEDGALPGVVRRFMLDYACRQNIGIQECALTKQDLLDADALMISNSVKGVRAVALLKFEEVCVNYTVKHELYLNLQGAYQDMLGSVS